MKKQIFLAALFASLASSHLLAQSAQHPVCGTQSPDETWESWFQSRISEYETKATQRSQSTTYVIPVVVHILHKSSEATGSGSNLKAAQVQAQIDALNDAMAGNAPGNNNAPAPFAAVDAGNTNITFCLATKDKNGASMTEPGIDRIDWGAKGWQDPSQLGNNVQSYFDQTVKPASIWDPTKYFNIWVGDFLGQNGAGLIGYATFPAGSGLTGIPSGAGTSTTDGVVMASRCFGCQAKFANGYYSQAAYAQGITTVHEVGHWLGCRHISGDASCGNDYCNDTPPQTGGNNGCQNGLNWGCPTYPFQANQCSGNSNGEMFMNFMDYSDDGCRCLYTANQATRMFTALNSGTYRQPLLTSGVCSNNPIANFAANYTSVCPGTMVTFTDQSANSPTNWSWTFQGGSPATSSSQNPNVTYNTAGTFQVKLVVSNSNGSDSLTKVSYITVSSAIALPLVEGFQNATFPPVNWTKNNANNDSIFWVRTTSAGGFGTSSACMFFDNYNQDAGGKKDEIFTPKYDFSNLASATLTFDVAYARYDATYSDTLAVLVSSDCGKTFTQVYIKGGTGLSTAPDQTNTIFVPSSSQWRTETINLNAYAGQANVLVNFQNRGYYGQGLYVDNINLSGVAQTTGIAPPSESLFSIYPNPSSGQFELVSGDSKQVSKVMIANALGQVFMIDTIMPRSKKQFDLSSHGPGVYFIDISSPGFNIVKKIIIK